MSLRDSFYLGFGSMECNSWMGNNVRVSPDSIKLARDIIFREAGHLPNFGMQDRDMYLS